MLGYPARNRCSITSVYTGAERFQIHGVDTDAALALLKSALAKVPNVMTEPTPDVEILTFNPFGPVLAVRPYCNNKHYWQVYFDTNRLIRNTFARAGFPVALRRAVRGRTQAGEGAAGGERGSILTRYTSPAQSQRNYANPD